MSNGRDQEFLTPGYLNLKVQLCNVREGCDGIRTSSTKEEKDPLKPRSCTDPFSLSMKRDGLFLSFFHVEYGHVLQDQHYFANEDHCSKKHFSNSIPADIRNIDHLGTQDVSQGQNTK